VPPVVVIGLAMLELGAETRRELMLLQKRIQASAGAKQVCVALTGPLDGLLLQKQSIPSRTWKGPEAVSLELFGLSIQQYQAL
jgi:hypothetical protein